MIVDVPLTALSDFDRAAYFDGVLRGAPHGARDSLRIARMYRAEAELLGMVNADRPLKSVLRAFTDRVEYLIPGSVASVHLISEDGRFAGTLGPRLPKEFREAINGEPVSPGQGSGGVLAATGRAVWNAAIATDEKRLTHAPLAELNGLQACWSVPVTDPTSGRVLATLAVYFGRPRSPDPIDMHVLDDIARILRIGIITSREEDLSVGLAEENERVVEELTRVLEATVEGIFGLDSQWRCTFINRAALEMLGIDSSDAVLGHDLHELIHHALPDGTEHPLEECPIVDTIRTGEPVVAHGELMWRSDGSSFSVALSAAPKLSAVTGGVVGAVVIFSDVTEHIQHQRQAEEALRSKDEFVASVAHELRTPLTAVVGFADILRDGWEQMEREEFTDLLGHVSQEAAEVASLVDDLLVAARASMGRLSLRLEEVDLAQEARRVLYGWRQGTLQHVKLMSDGEGLVTADAARVRQILRNLLANALRYGGDIIDVQVGRDGEYRLIDVVDNGTGVPLPPEEVESIFEPYARAHDIPGLTASLGLGLAISRSLAQAMGGHLTYLRVDDRTHFRLALPVI